MATKKLSLLLVAFLTCASQPALTQGGGGGGGGRVAALPLAVQVVAQPPVVQVVAQRTRGSPASRVVKQERQGRHPANAGRSTSRVRDKSRCLPQRLQIIEVPRPLRIRHRQLRKEFRRAAPAVRLRTGDLSAPWDLVPARPNSHIDR